jgi:hypothetical protein
MNCRVRAGPLSRRKSSKRVQGEEPLVGCPSGTHTRNRIVNADDSLAVSRIRTATAGSARRVARLEPVQEWYDPSMTRSKIAISLPKDQLVRVQQEVRAGRADSVSGYIARVLAEQERRESLRELVGDLIEKYGKPAAEDVKWAERALASRRG